MQKSGCRADVVSHEMQPEAKTELHVQRTVWHVLSIWFKPALWYELVCSLVYSGAHVGQTHRKEDVRVAWNHGPISQHQIPL